MSYKISQIASQAPFAWNVCVYQNCIRMPWYNLTSGLGEEGILREQWNVRGKLEQSIGFQAIKDNPGKL